MFIKNNNDKYKHIYKQDIVSEYIVGRFEGVFSKVIDRFEQRGIVSFTSFHHNKKISEFPTIKFKNDINEIIKTIEEHYFIKRNN